MKKLILIQHCQSEHHINGMSGGWTDTPLTELGRKQADSVGKRLLEVLDGSYTIVSSDLLRAAQTANIIGDIIGIKTKEEPCFREHNFGVATNTTREWFQANVAPLPDKGRLEHRAFEGAESWREFYLRIADGLSRLEESDNDNVILVTHGGVVRNIICWWLDIPIECLSAMFFAGKPGGITVLSKDIHNFRTLEVLSDLRHLEGLS